MNARVNLVEPPYSTEVQSCFDSIMPAGIPPLSIFRAVANNPRVLSRMVAGGLLDRGSISLADRELIILRMCGLSKAEYEWGVHVVGFSQKAGFNQEQISNTAADSIDHRLWTDAQNALLDLVEELHSSSRVSEPLWTQLERIYEPEQLIEIVMLAGLYKAVSYVVNALQIENEVFAPSFTQTKT